jgi:threonine-phosphate decarboxylase
MRAVLSDMFLRWASPYPNIISEIVLCAFRASAVNPRRGVSTSMKLPNLEISPPHGGDLERAIARFGGERAEWIDFSNSINPWGIPDARLRELTERSVPLLREYPDPEYVRLREALARYHGIAPECIWPFNGSVAGFYSVAGIFADAPSVAPAPSFREYAHAAAAHGLSCAEPILWAAPHEDDSWLEAIPENGVFFLAHPNSPTGGILSRELIERILETARARSTTVLLDEAFLPFVMTAARHSLLEAAATTENLIVLRSLTKSHALPGLRLGYAVTMPATISRLRAVTPPWSVGPLATVVAEALPDLEPLIQAQLADLAVEAAWFRDQLRALRFVRVSPSCCNFFLCELMTDRLDASALKEQLCRRHLLIRTCSDYPGLGSLHFRLAVRRREENERLIAALGEIVAS